MRGGSFEKITLAPYNLDSLGQSFFDGTTPMYPNEPSVLIMNTDTEVVFTNCHEAYEIRSLIAGCSANYAFESGTLMIDSSCTGGDITVSGIAYVDNNSSLAINDLGLVNKEQLIKASWEHIHINTGSLNTGTEFPVGTANYPVNNIADALLISAQNNIRSITVVGSISLPVAVTDVDFTGDVPQESVIIINGSLLDSVCFQSCTLTGAIGVGSGALDFRDCYLANVSNLLGFSSRCQIEGNISIANGEVFSAIKTVIEGDNTIFNLQEQMCTLSMDVDSGLVQIINSVDGCLVELNVKGGEVSLGSSCVGGDYYLEGIGTLFNDSAMTKKENHFIWDETMEYHTDLGGTGATLISKATKKDVINASQL